MVADTASEMAGVWCVGNARILPSSFYDYFLFVICFRFVASSAMQHFTFLAESMLIVVMTTAN